MGGGGVLRPRDSIAAEDPRGRDQEMALTLTLTLTLM